jgi:hypothetical protein
MFWRAEMLDFAAQRAVATLPPTVPDTPRS